jgi:hypothetical protein
MSAYVYPVTLSLDLAGQERATALVQIAELDGKAETVVWGPLGLDQIEFGMVEGAVPDQALLVDRHINKSRPLAWLEKWAAQPAHPSGS